MTRKPDPLLQVPPFIPRRHFACRLRDDLADMVRAKCRELNCSQGVFFEVMIGKALMSELVTQKDVFDYSSSDRWLHRVLSDFVTQPTTRLDDPLLKAARTMLSKIVPGTDA